jgi:D-3-phosphoglycerate dehydrogenase/C-terminal binding protein
MRGKAFGMDVCYYDPYAAAGSDKSLGIRHAETLDELLRDSFVLICQCPLTPETRHMLDAAAISKMPRGSYLVNTGRGAVVDSECIPELIRSGHLAGVGLDVLEVEPPPETHALVKAWRNPADPCHHRVILTPHSAFYSEEGLREIRVKSAMNCRRVLIGGKPINVVN